MLAPSAIAILRDAPRPWPIRELLPLVGESPLTNIPVLDVGCRAAQTVGTLSMRLDPSIPQEAEALRVVQETFNALLKGATL